MKIIYLITIAFSLFISLSASQLICRIQGNYDEGILATGNVTISEEKDGRLSFSFSINQLPRGDHAVHVHEFGDLREPFGTNVGGHYKENSVCVGNLNQSISTQRSGPMQTETKATLSLSNKDSSITYPSLVGRSIVIHKNPENCTGAPNPKIAVCVIGYLPPATGVETAVDEAEVAVVDSTCVISPYSVSESPTNATVYLIASGDKIELSWDKDLSEYYFNILKYWDGKTPLNKLPIPLTANKTTVGDKILNGMTITLVKKETKQVQTEEPPNTEEEPNSESVITEIVYTEVGKCTIGIRFQPAPPTTTTTSTTSTSTTADGTTSTTGEGTSTTGTENTVVTTSSEATTTTTDSTTEVTTGTVPDPTSTTATSTSTTSTSDTATTATSTSSSTTGSPSTITPTQDQPGRGGLIVGIVMAAIVLLAMIIIMIRRNQQANKRAGFNRMYGEF